MAKDPEYGKDVRDMIPWSEVDFKLPGDKTLGETLKQIGKADPTANDEMYFDGLRRTVRERHRDRTCAWSRANCNSVAGHMANTVFPDMSFHSVYTVFEGMSKCKPNDGFYPDIYRAGLDSKDWVRFISTEDGELGMIEEIQATCHRPGCPDPDFRTNQLVVLDDNSDCIHASVNDQNVQARPVDRYPESCSGVNCVDDFKRHPFALLSIFSSLPKHLKEFQGHPFTCDGTRMTKAGREIEEIDRARMEGERE